jgi:hypothetical protein
MRMNPETKSATCAGVLGYTYYAWGYRALVKQRTENAEGMRDFRTMFGAG